MKILTEILGVRGPSVETPSSIIDTAEGCKIKTGNLTLHLYDPDLGERVKKQCMSDASASEQLGLGNSENEHFVMNNVYWMGKRGYKYYVTVHNKILDNSTNYLYK